MTSPARRQEPGLAFQRLSWALGAQVLGLDLRQPISQAAGAALRGALAEHGFLLFRDQAVTPEQHVALTASIGELAARDPLIGKYALPENPDILLVTNIRDREGVQSPTATTGRQWHSDQSYISTPTVGCMLRCVEVPALGGTTIFNNMYLAYETLSESMRGMLKGLKGVHNYLNYREHENRPKLDEKIVAAIPPTQHPIVVRNPETGREALYVSEMMVDRFDGMTPAESRGLLDFLNSHATQPAFCYRHHWRPDDLLLWDNQFVMHYAPADYDFRHPELPGNRRVMHRTTLYGRATIAA